MEKRTECASIEEWSRASVTRTTLRKQLSTKMREYRARIVKHLRNTQKRSINRARARECSLRLLSRRFQTDAREIYSTHLSSEFRQWYGRRRAEQRLLVASKGISSEFDLESLYLTVRLLKPQVVVETGVLYGSSSSFILEALRENGGGKLYSIDRKPEKALPKDFFVRSEAREAWELILGEVQEELPKLLAHLGSICLFHHDTVHTFAHQTWEYSQAFPYLRRGGILSSHDVLTLPFEKNAFNAFCTERKLAFGKFLNFGMVFKE